jgi:hypothetical protein
MKPMPFFGEKNHQKVMCFSLFPVKLPKEANGVRVVVVPINGMTLQCPLLETIIIRCSKDDKEIQMMVNAMVAKEINLEKINVKFYEDLAEKIITE